MSQSTTGSPLPTIIQGGMGIGVSGWRLARAVSSRGQLGVVSATAIDSVFVRRLQDGDPGGHLRRAMDHFPLPGIAAAALRRYFREGGRPSRRALSHARHVSQGRRSGSRAADHAGQLRGGLAGKGGPRRAGRREPPHQDTASQSRHPVRRDARRRGLRAHGRRDTARDPGRARCARCAPTGEHTARDRRRVARPRRDQSGSTRATTGRALCRRSWPARASLRSSRAARSPPCSCARQAAGSTAS